MISAPSFWVYGPWWYTQWPMEGHTTQIHITIPDTLLETVDQQARGLGMSRSALIRLALLEKLDMQSIFDTDMNRRKQAKEAEFMKQLEEMAAREDAKLDADVGFFDQ